MPDWNDLSSDLKSLISGRYPGASGDAEVKTCDATTATLELPPSAQRHPVQAGLTEGDRGWIADEEVQVDVMAILSTAVGTGGDAGISAWESTRAAEYGTTAAEWRRRVANVVMTLLGDL
jgi:hypothetical protein